jgi:outer membrane protein
MFTFLETKNLKNMRLKYFYLSIGLCLSFNLSAQSLITLDQAVEIALKSNLDLLIAGNDAKQADNNNHAGNAGMLPSVSVNVSDNPSLSNINQKFTNGTIIEKNGVSSNNFNAALVFSYTLFDGKKMFATRRKLEILDEAAQNKFNSQVQTVISNVVLNYSNITRLKAYLKVLDLLRDLSQQRLDIIGARQLAGLANNTDLFLAELDLESRKQNINAQKSSINKAYNSLNLLLNIKIDSLYDVEDVFKNTSLLDKNKMDELLRNNPENQWAINQYNIALQAQKEIDAARLPLLKLNGAYNYTISQSAAGFSLYNQSTGPQAGLSLVLPLFNGNINKSNSENAKLNVQSSEWRMALMKQNIEAVYEQAWQDYSMSKLQLGSDSMAVVTANKYMELMQERFKLGQSTIVDLKEAQRTFEETNYRMISNWYIARIAETQLLALTGQLIGR